MRSFEGTQYYVVVYSNPVEGPFEHFKLFDYREEAEEFLNVCIKEERYAILYSKEE